MQCWLGSYIIHCYYIGVNPVLLMYILILCYIALLTVNKTDGLLWIGVVFSHRFCFLFKLSDAMAKKNKTKLNHPRNPIN